MKDRLILLNTIENDGGGGGGTNSAYTNRCRYSFNGSPFATNAWYEPNQSDNAATTSSNAAGAGFIDATTKEAMISAEFIKDRLIVFFERSTWELAYTGNQILPFVWQKINTELGSESQQSSVAFDKQILTIGNTGVHACNGANVERIDDKIPDSIFNIVDTNLGVQRVAGIRDYFVEMVYWTFPAEGTNPEEGQVYPNRVLVYNYKNGAWAFNDDCITAFGYFEQQLDITWALATFTWEETSYTWVSGVELPQSRQVIGGNQEGYTFLIVPDYERNAPVLQITNITVVGGDTILTIIDHTLNPSIPDVVAIENTGTVLDGLFFVVAYLPVANPLNTVSIGPTLYAGGYLGGGTATRVSNINIKTKQWNPYSNKDQNVYLSRIDFGVFRTTNGEITIDYSPSATNLSMINAGVNTNTIMGTSILETSPYDPLLYPLEQEQQRLWHPIFFQTEGNCIQLSITFSVYSNYYARYSMVRFRYRSNGSSHYGSIDEVNVMANSNQYGSFVVTTNVWDTPGLYSVKDPIIQQLLVRLYQNVNEISLVTNVKDTGFYNTDEYVNGQLWFPNPLNNSSDTNATQFRQVLRKVINFGPLPNTATKSVAHGIICNTSTTFTRIYATASDTTGFNYIPIPYSSPILANNIEINVDATDVNITTGSNRSNFNICYVVLEFLQS